MFQKSVNGFQDPLERSSGKTVDRMLVDKGARGAYAISSGGMEHGYALKSIPLLRAMRLQLKCQRCGGSFEFDLKPPTTVVECPYCGDATTSEAHTPAANPAHAPALDPRRHGATRILLWSLAPLVALPVVYGILNSDSGSTADNVAKVGPLLVLYAFVWIWHLVFAFRCFGYMMRQGWDWRLLIGGLFSILGICFWPLMALLTAALSGI